MKKSKKIQKLSLNNKKVLTFFLILLSLLFILLIVRIGFLQLILGNELKAKASAQQTTTRTIYANRGTIYDCNGKVLAASANVDTISVNPQKLLYSDKTEVPKDIIASKFSELFQLDYTETLNKLNEDSTYVVIANKVNTSTTDLLRSWLKENKINYGVNIDSTINRYYPYNNLASNLIGFTGTDTHGRWGLEYTLDDILSGVDGKVVMLTDSINSEIPNQEKTYIEAKDGDSVYLTIDVYIQSVCEKYLEQAVTDNFADGGTAIAMNPSTGEIYAMATYPNYNPNTPFTPTDSKLLSTWDNLSKEEQSQKLYSMWNNSATQNTYEPGSTFKLITTAVALEEGIVTTDKDGDFYCSGSHKVGDTTISCWKTDGSHSYQSLRKALCNSCNPAFMQLGARIGAPTLYKYFNAFGLFDKTNPQFFYGEANSTFWDLKNVGDVELATMSFGQRFSITPLQLITAVSAITNEGVLVEPQIVKSRTNSSTNSVSATEVVNKRQVISKETSAKMLDLMESVVENGTGRYAKVSGYSVGGKSGTSEPLEAKTNEGYVASFIGVAPVANPQVVVLVAIYDPKGASGHQGGQVAGPVVSQILTEILPSLNIVSNNDANTSKLTNTYNTTAVPDVRSMSISEANKTLKNAGFSVNIGNAESTELVTDQTPKPGSLLLKDSIVYLYTDNNNIKTSVTVPNFKGMSAAQAINSANSKGLNLNINGSGIVISQDTASESNVEVGTVITVNLSKELNGGY